MFERGWHQMVFAAMLHLLTRGVSCRMPTTPLARHRDVVTTQGTVRGYYAPHPPHYAFLGVPYARPPTRRARFKAPEPPPPWSGTFEATHRVKCPQPDGSGEENCLVVNVFMSEHATSQPVIVYFHGGGFQQGWGFYSTPKRLLDQGFVVVTFNYRLGALGFLCLGSENIPGNAGLKDQVAALYWVNRNIEKFGGDSSDVTAYGTGSGAVSIELLIFSGLTRDLFQKTILDSGSALSPSAISHKPLSNAYNFANHLDYKHTSKFESLEEFYYKVSHEKITNTSNMFLPCVQSANDTANTLLDRDPRDYLLSGKYQNVPMIITYTNAEETLIIADNTQRFDVKPENFERLLPNNLIFDSESTRNRVASLVKDFYFNELELTESVIQSYTAYVNDIFMEYPIVKLAVHHAHNQNLVFLLKCLYKDRSSDKYEYIQSACFGGLLHYTFAKNELLEYEEVMAQRLITMWTNFIKLGDPTPLTTPLITEVWQPLVPHVVDNKVVLRNIPCLMFGRTMSNGLLFGQQFAFWDLIYDKFYINLLA